LKSVRYRILNDATYLH
jgi:hypothetical protein